MSSSVPPLRIFFDRTSPIESKGEGSLIWVVVNNSEETFEKVRVSALLSNPKHTILPTELQIRLTPGARYDIHQFVDLTQSDAELVFHLQLDSYTQSGKHYAMHRPSPIRMPNLPAKGEERILEIEGDHVLVDKANLSNRTKVIINAKDAGAILNSNLGRVRHVVLGGKHLTLGDSSIPEQSATEVDLRRSTELHVSRDDDLAEIQGFNVSIIDAPAKVDHGVFPPNIEQFALTWPHKKDIYLMFIDDRGVPYQRAPRIDDSYRLLLHSPHEGHATLIAQGSSGKYYVDTSSAWQCSGGASKTLTLPREPQWFGDAGTERALLLLTSEPLDVPAESMSAVTEPDITRLLQHTLTLHGASLAFTKALVETNAWRL